MPPSERWARGCAGVLVLLLPVSLGELVFSPPVLITAAPGVELGADSFAAIDVDAAGQHTTIYSGARSLTSYDSGLSWEYQPPRRASGDPNLPGTNWHSGESSTFPGLDGRLHGLGAIEHCPPNGCWTHNHTRSSCNNVSEWVPARNGDWAGCKPSAVPAPLSQQWFTTAPAVGYWYKNASDGKLWAGSECRPVVFRGLPLELNNSWGMCDGFTSPTKVALPDGSILATFPLVFQGEHPPTDPVHGNSLIVNHLPMSLVVFKSVDGGFEWEFQAVAANFTAIPGMPAGQPNPYNLTHSAYGPQENSMALLADNETVMIAFRPDTDSMCPGGPVPYKFYYQVYSKDFGKTWSAPAPIAGVGCVRPRMLKLPGNGPLLLTGGRLCEDLVPNTTFAGHGCLPQGNGQGGIFLWANMDGMADAPAGTAKHGAEWETHCLGAIHNQLLTHDPKYRFIDCSGATGPCGSQTYNSLVPLGPRSAGIFYQNGYAGPNASTWMMRVDFRPATNHRASHRANHRASHPVTDTARVRAKARARASSSKFGIGVYGDGDGSALTVASQLPWAHRLVGNGGRVVLYVGLLFSRNGDPSSCLNNCVPTPRDVAAVQQAYGLGLRPVIRLGQWPRTIRDFSDDSDSGQHRVYTALARVYRAFAAALPLPPDGSPLEVVVHNELNGGVEWQCSGNGTLSVGRTAAEVAGCLRDTLAALRTLPRMRLSATPTAYTSAATYPCAASSSPASPVNYSNPTDVPFMEAMLRAVPDLYQQVDFFNAHSYPFGDQPFSSPLGRAGAVHYRAQLDATGRPELPVLITEAGWHGHDEAAKAASIVAAFEEEWLLDARVEAVMPFLLSATDGSPFAEQGWSWVQWPSGGGGGGGGGSDGAQPRPSLQFNATKALRCRLGVGGAC